MDKELLRQGREIAKKRWRAYGLMGLYTTSLLMALYWFPNPIIFVLVAGMGVWAVLDARKALHEAKVCERDLHEGVWKARQLVASSVRRRYAVVSMDLDEGWDDQTLLAMTGHLNRLPPKASVELSDGRRVPCFIFYDAGADAVTLVSADAADNDLLDLIKKG